MPRLTLDPKGFLRLTSPNHSKYFLFSITLPPCPSIESKFVSESKLGIVSGFGAAVSCIIFANSLQSILRWLPAVLHWLWAASSASVDAAELDGAVWAVLHSSFQVATVMFGWLWAGTIASGGAAELDGSVSCKAAAACSLLGRLGQRCGVGAAPLMPSMLAIVANAYTNSDTSKQNA